MKIVVLIGGIAYEIQKRLLEGIIKCAKMKKISIHVFTCNGDLYKQSEHGIGEFQIYRLPDLAQYDGIIFRGCRSFMLITGKLCGNNNSSDRSSWGKGIVLPVRSYGKSGEYRENEGI